MGLVGQNWVFKSKFGFLVNQVESFSFNAKNCQNLGLLCQNLGLVGQNIVFLGQNLGLLGSKL